MIDSNGKFIIAISLQIIYLGSYLKINKVQGNFYMTLQKKMPTLLGFCKDGSHIIMNL